MKEAIRRSGRHCGVLGTSSQDLLDRQAQGFRWLGLGMDAGLLVRALSDALQAVGSPRRLQASLHPVPPGETAAG
jgi:2-keto-3-deoxy-L-rhamnonate aldolase RhmA